MSGAGDHLQKLANGFGGSTSSLASNGNLKHKNSITNMMLMPSASGLISGGTMMTVNNRYVKLNVGGRLFTTSLDTLTKQDSMLRAMFSGRLEVATDQDGYVLIDRCGRHFELILDYLRDDDPMFVSLHMADKSELELYEILKEAKFYCIQSLVGLIESKILSNKADIMSSEPYYGSSIVSMVTSKSELAKILNSTDKPCIRLLFNRHNNKYSYTNTSDDNLLKNIELFERMAIKFKNRIMFIKDTTNTEEICCWYFHGGGKKLAEVCCTSIVYTTEKKQTKVEFPDSKILEEIFVNAVLFESKETSNAGTNENSSSSSGQLARGASSTDQNDMDNENLIEDMLAPRLSLSATCNQIVSSTTSNSASANTSATPPLAASSIVSSSTTSSPNTVTAAAAASSSSSSTNPNTSNIVGAISSGVSSLSLNSSGNAANGSVVSNGNAASSNSRRGGSNGAGSSRS